MTWFEIRGRRFSGYTVMLYVGLLVALVVADQLARRSGLSPARVVAAMALAMPVLLAGSRLLVVLLHWPYFRRRPRELARMEHGGAAMYGALPPALLITIPLLAWLDLPYGAFWDIGAGAILAGMIPTRFGCLSGGCCAGRATHSFFGVRLRTIRGVRERRFPSQVFEAALGAGLLCLLFVLWDSLPFEGAAFCVALGGYALGRLLLEGLRENRGRLYAGLGAHQWISIVLAGCSAVALTAGSIVASPVGEHLAAAPASATTAHLIASAVALLPVMYLFRFLGCDLIFTLEEPEKQFLRLGVIVPPEGAVDQYEARIAFTIDGTNDEIAGSPFELPFKPPVLPDGSPLFEATVEIPEGAYIATCTVTHPAVVTRIGSCSGVLNGPGLSVLFFAVPGTPIGEIPAELCFEPVP